MAGRTRTAAAVVEVFQDFAGLPVEHRQQRDQDARKDNILNHGLYATTGYFAVPSPCTCVVCVQLPRNTPLGLVLGSLVW